MKIFRLSFSSRVRMFIYAPPSEPCCYSTLWPRARVWFMCWTSSRDSGQTVSQTKELNPPLAWRTWQRPIREHHSSTKELRAPTLYTQGNGEEQRSLQQTNTERNQDSGRCFHPFEDVLSLLLCKVGEINSGLIYRTGCQLDFHLHRRVCIFKSAFRVNWFFSAGCGEARTSSTLFRTSVSVNERMDEWIGADIFISFMLHPLQ